MKKILATIAAVLVTAFIFAQTPQKMSYQAVIRDIGSNLVKSLTVGMRISILQGFVSGTVVYTETQTPTTNVNGLVSIEIGGGTGFNSIDWSLGPYFLKTETDPTGGTNYTITGTTQLLSVPYAIYSIKAQTADYNNLTNLPNLSIYLTTESDPVFGASPAHGISAGIISNWNTAFGWGNHAGLYRPIGWVPAWTDITGKPSFSAVATSGSYNDLLNLPSLFNGSWASLTGKPTTLSGYGITDAMNNSHPANGITSTNIANWSVAFGWGNHASVGYAIFPAQTGNNGKYLTTNGTITSWNALAAVATSGSFNDLSNKPTILNSQWTTSGSNIYYNSGNVGIGVASPTLKLEVFGRARFQTYDGSAGFWLMNVANSLNRSFIGMYNDDYVGLYGAGGNTWGLVMNVNNGNVGIGIATPTAKLHVAGDTRLNNSMVGDGIELMTYATGNRYAGIDFHSDDTYTDFALRIIRNNTGPDASSQIIHRGLGELNLWTQDAAPISFYTTNNQRMIIAADGKVGIGTATPVTKFTITENLNTGITYPLYIQNASGDWSATEKGVGLKFGRVDPTSGHDYGTIRGTIASGSGAQGRLQFIGGPGNTPHMTIDGLGNVGIGTTTPTTKLDVRGEISVTGVINVNDHTIQGVATPTYDSDAANKAYVDNNSGIHTIGEYYGGGIVFYVYDNGQHGLIAAKADQGSAVVWTNTAFQFTSSNAVRNGINAGLANTERIIIQAGEGSYAAQLCANYRGGDFADWYLPSRYELNLLYQQRAVVGGLGFNVFWSSTEEYLGYAWCQYFLDGNQFNKAKYTQYFVRAIRAF
jgi:hypothetical protein